MEASLAVRDYPGLQPYQPIWQAMQQLTDTRDQHQQDEIWLLQHQAVFTQGVAGKAEHVLAPGDIPVVQVDRGGQVTYHGPGQLVAYLMLDIRRLGLGVRELVTAIETSVIQSLRQFDIDCYAEAKAPGVYVAGKKIASLGLRIRKGCTFHGLAINVDMDLQPFSRINPCGYQGLEVTQIKQFVPSIKLPQVAEVLLQVVQSGLAYQRLDRLPVQTFVAE